jgi:hypothetical protein
LSSATSTTVATVASAASDASAERAAAMSGWHFFIVSRYASLISSVVADDETPRSA